MQSDPQDEQGPVAGGNEAVEPGPSSGPASSSPQDTGPQYPMPGSEAPAQGDSGVLPPQMPTEPSGNVTPPQMPGQPAPSWDVGAEPVPQPPGGPDAGSVPAAPAVEGGPAVGGYADEPTPLAGDEVAHQDEAAYPEPTPRTVAATAGVATPPLAPDQAVADDWVGRICPYLLSEDGSYRSTQPDEGHRCTAQEPKGTLPLAFQERYCLTDKHERCEMYKFAQEQRAGGSDGVAVPPPQAGTTSYRAAVGTVSAAHGGSGRGTGGTGSAGDGDSRRPMVIAIVAIGLLILLVLVTLLLSGGGSDEPDPVASMSPDPAATSAPAAETPTPRPDPTPEPEITQAPDLTAQPTEGAAAGRQNISYQVQEGEALLRIADNFGTTRQRIIRANEGMADKQPYVVPGDIIIVPASGELTVEELESFPGYLGPAS